MQGFDSLIYNPKSFRLIHKRPLYTMGLLLPYIDFTLCSYSTTVTALPFTTLLITYGFVKALSPSDFK